MIAAIYPTALRAAAAPTMILQPGSKLGIRLAPAVPAAGLRPGFGRAGFLSEGAPALRSAPVDRHPPAPQQADHKY